ncbi:hypothetical protein LguiA_029941 [Lonicera macranthoides]
MRNSSAFASASAADPLLLVGEYDVFLNFCGQDTRYGFTDYLYTSLDGVGIRTFRDSESLHVGEEIGSELLKAITDSKISIPIFSKNYAFKKWCLLELTHMVQCLKNGGQMIFPIFYDVDPDDVQHQRDSYEEAFRQYRKRRYDKKVIQEWKNALKKAGQLKGLELQKETGGHQGELVTIIRDKVLKFLKQNNVHEDLDLVGMPSRIEKMEELLNIHSDGVRFIGIHGMGGLGKTTIAKAIYDKYQHHFECHSFLRDVRKSESRLVNLQEKLLSDICKTTIPSLDDSDEGSRRIKYVVCKKKVLIVLDDVNKVSQIYRLAGSWRWFGAGSRIIITTRDEEVLRALELTCKKEQGPPGVYASYHPDLLNDDDSLKLFSHHAFMRKSPPEGYDTLSKEVASTAAGLPLVLKVTGSSLYDETDKELWEDKIKRLKEVPDEEVQEKLRLSIDPLTEAQKLIFVDIACLFIGQNKINPCYMWDDYKISSRIELKVLKRKSLITVGDDGILGMHDQLRDLGRQIVREGNLDALVRWSRLWDSDNAFEVYMTAQGTENENVKALCLDRCSVPNKKRWLPGRRTRDDICLVYDDPRRLIGEKFVGLQHLRYLTLDARDTLYGDFEPCLLNLRWLQWRYHVHVWESIVPTNLQLRNLVILDLSSSYIMEDSDLWSQIQRCKKLKVLDLHGCSYLRRIPFLSTFSNLERLEVDDCGLCSLDGIEELESLIYLDATCCQIVKTLPNLSKLTKLKELKVSIGDIPGLDKLESVELLCMSSCKSLQRLPDMSNLKRLKELHASGMILTEIRGLGGLKSLEVLHISDCIHIERVFDLMNLKRLRRLDIRCCPKLIDIPGLKGLESLECLSMDDCKSIKTLPDLSKLKSLKALSVRKCEKLTEIKGLEELKSLEYLDISNCKSIENLPDFSNLKKLDVINATGCKNLTEIRGLENLQSFENLFAYECRSLDDRIYYQVPRIRKHLHLYEYNGFIDRLRSRWNFRNMFPPVTVTWKVFTNGDDMNY